MKAAAVVLAIAVGLNAATEALAQSHIIGGAGVAVSCGEWTRLRRAAEQKTGNNRELSTLYQIETWVDGFLSGMNFASEGQNDFLTSNRSSVAWYAWIDNYCAAAPLDKLAAAAIKLSDELRLRSK